MSKENDSENFDKTSWAFGLIDSWNESVELFKTDDYDFSEMAQSIIDDTIESYRNGEKTEGMGITVKFTDKADEIPSYVRESLANYFVFLLNQWCIIAELGKGKKAYIAVLRLLVYNEKTHRLDMHFSDGIIEALSCLSEIGEQE